MRRLALISCSLLVASCSVDALLVLELVAAPEQLTYRIYRHSEKSCDADFGDDGTRPVDQETLDVPANLGATPEFGIVVHPSMHEELVRIEVEIDTADGTWSWCGCPRLPGSGERDTGEGALQGELERVEGEVAAAREAAVPA